VSDSLFRRTLEVEYLKCRRAPVMWVVSAVIGVAVPLLATAAILAVRSDASGTFAIKAASFVHGTEWPDLYSVASQVLSVAGLLAFGIMWSWCFGREFAEGTVVSLFALPISRQNIATAKLVVLGLWGALICVATIVVVVALGFVIGLGARSDAMDFWRPALVGLLTVLNALPLAWVASVRRGYLAAFGALLGVVVTTQLAVAAGAGAWIPFATPSLWAGMGGDAAADSVTAAQLLLPVAVGLLGAVATRSWWHRAQLGDS
jgi:ABC-2 type transport system permease protein